MSQGKHLIFSEKPGSEPRRRRKADAESAFLGAGLSKRLPAELRECPAGARAWKHLLSVYESLPAEVLSSLDRDYVLTFCLAVEGRQRAFDLELKLSKAFDTGEVNLDSLLRIKAELRQSNRLVADLARGLYATPRSRGGVAPSQRQLSPEEIIDRELSELSKILEGDQ